MRFPSLLAAGSMCLMAATTFAKLPPPSDEAKAKAAEATAKTAHGGKVENFKLCKSMDAVASAYFTSAKKSGKDVKTAAETPACADPGPFVYPPPDPAAAGAKPAAAPATKAAAAPAPAKK